MPISTRSISGASTIGYATAGSTLAGGSWTDFGGVTDGSITNNNSMVDVTHNDIKGVCREYGNEDTTLSVTVIYDPSDTGQAALRDAARNKTKLAFRVREIVGSGEDEWAFDGLIESFERNAGANNTRLTASFTIQSDGVKEYGTQ